MQMLRPAIIAITACFCLVPEVAAKKVDSHYGFKTNGYYDRYLK